MVKIARGTKDYPLWDFRGKTVVDIGAHLGGFSVRAARRGAKAVWSFEANPANVEVLRRNCAKYPSVRVEDACAVVGASAPRTATLRQRQDSDLRCRMGVIDSPQFGEAVVEIPTVTLDAIIEMAGAPIDILKIDCEGAEYDILMTSKRLQHVRVIVGEWHRFGPGQDPEKLQAHLKSKGFKTRFFDRYHPNDQFWARRR